MVSWPRARWWGPVGECAGEGSPACSSGTWAMWGNFCTGARSSPAQGIRAQAMMEPDKPDKGVKWSVWRCMLLGINPFLSLFSKLWYIYIWCVCVLCEREGSTFSCSRGYWSSNPHNSKSIQKKLLSCLLFSFEIQVLLYVLWFCLNVSLNSTAFLISEITQTQW